MSMLPCRVLCLLAIVLCCVGVAHAESAADDYPDSFQGFVERARKIVNKTLRLKEECVNAGMAALKAADEAQLFVDTTKEKLENIAADQEEVKRTKIKGDELIENAMKAAEKAKELADKIFESKTENEKKTAVLFQEELDKAREVFKDAENAAHDAEQHAEKAVKLAFLVLEVLQKLEAAVAAAKEKGKEKQVEPQPQEQTNETSLLPNNASITNGTKRND
ncbi:uncharacterized protein TM35_000841140, partial [Trypanosoma theileri]